MKATGVRPNRIRPADPFAPIRPAHAIACVRPAGLFFAAVRQARAIACVRPAGLFFAAALTLIAALAPSSLPAQDSLALDLADTPIAEGVLSRGYGADGIGDRGVPVAGGYDCNGDGLPDLVIAFMQADPLGRANAGEIDVLLGDGTLGDAIDTADQTNPRVLRFYGAITGETAGNCIWMDDVTGDGLGDLLIGRQNAQADGRVGAGALTIVPGSADWTTQAASFDPVDLATSPSALTRTDILGAQQYDRLGIFVRTGDFDGDGIADIVVGADQEDHNAESNTGAAYLIRGGAHLASGATIDLAEFGSTALAGNIAKVQPPPGSTNLHLAATCNIGDLDGNGLGDVLLAQTLRRSGAGLIPPGAPAGEYSSSGGVIDGGVYVLWDDNYSSPTWPAGFTIDLASPPGALSDIRGGAPNISFGEEILAGLDYDNNGRPDLFAGDIVGDWSPLADRPASGSGHVLYDAENLKGVTLAIDDLPPTVSMTTFIGPTAGDIAGDTATHGDYDGDGIADLAIAIPHDAPLGRTDAGRVVIFYGESGGWPETIDLGRDALAALNAAAVGLSLATPGGVRFAEILGANGTDGLDKGDTLMYSAGGIADIDQDGRDDIIFNEMVGNGLAPGTIDVGNLVVVGGAALLDPPPNAARHWQNLE